MNLLKIKMMAFKNKNAKYYILFIKFSKFRIIKRKLLIAIHLVTFAQNNVLSQVVNELTLRQVAFDSNL